MLYTSAFSQDESWLKANFDIQNRNITISHLLKYTNNSKQALSEIYLLDWNHAFSSKTTPLAKRFEEDFKRSFHYSSEIKKGHTTIHHILNNNEVIYYERLKNHPDVIKIHLKTPLAPLDSISLDINYTSYIPDHSFTGYGMSKNNIAIRYWHLAPAPIKNNKWIYFSHKDLNDFCAKPSTYHLEISHPKTHTLYTDLKKNNDTLNTGIKTFKGTNTQNICMYFEEKKANSIKISDTKEYLVISNLDTKGITTTTQKKIHEKIIHFLSEFYGNTPIDNTYLILKEDYQKTPLYGLNQLPKWLRVFPKEFIYELKTLKQCIWIFQNKLLLTNTRKDTWITEGLQYLVLQKYIQTHYPDIKLLGNLSQLPLIKNLEIGKAPFKEQWYLGYKNTEANYLQQPLHTPKDQLIKFNSTIANPYKAALILNYLKAYTQDKEYIKTVVQSFTKKETPYQIIDTEDFVVQLEKHTKKNIKWFSDDFLKQQSRPNSRIKKIIQETDSTRIILENKRSYLPVHLKVFNQKKLVNELWTSAFKDTMSISFPKRKKYYFELDPDQKLPEVNRRDNFSKTHGLLRKKLKIRLSKDIENPRYYQNFVTPTWGYNLYDGFLLSTRWSNRTWIRNDFTYNITPTYTTTSKKILGSIGFIYSHQFKNDQWYLGSIAVNASTTSYTENLLFKKFTASASLAFRKPDLRKNHHKTLNLKHISIQREQDLETPLPSPNYSIWNLSFSNSDANMDHILSYKFNIEHAKNFNKIQGIFNFRKLFLNDRQLHFRIFAGTFLNNQTVKDHDDFFSFALDRPTDYLFQYPYLGRNETTGFFSQEFITAEGNFKSKLKVRYANKWLVTTSIENSIWNWIHAYVDIGIVKNNNTRVNKFYDSGIKLNLVQDYFELYFPLQSSLGFEPNLGNYASRIRFKAALSFSTITKLFSRRWY